MAESSKRVCDEAIRLRSYLIWEAEGQPSGRAEAHWLRAKSELEAEFATNIALPKPAIVVMPRVPIMARPKKRIASKVERAVA